MVDTPMEKVRCWNCDIKLKGTESLRDCCCACTMCHNDIQRGIYGPAPSSTPKEPGIQGPKPK